MLDPALYSAELQGYGQAHNCPLLICKSRLQCDNFNLDSIVKHQYICTYIYTHMFHIYNICMYIPHIYVEALTARMIIFGIGN